MAAKSGVGGALSPRSRLWFTLSRGIVTEVYQPTLDQAAIADLRFVVSDPDGFFSDEKVDCCGDVRPLAIGVPAYTVENQCRHGRYRINKEIIVDPARDVLLQRVRFTPRSNVPPGLRLFVLLSPRLGDQGKENSGWVGNYRDWPMLFAQREDHVLALACSADWRCRSVGFVGTSDALRDIQDHGSITRPFGRADHGNILLAGEIDISDAGEFILALSFGRSPDAAGLNAVMSLNGSFDAARDAYIQHWQTWQRDIVPLDAEETALLVRENAWQRARPDQSRPHVGNAAADNANLYRTSTMVMRAHRSKQFVGAGVASLSVPWGEARGDDDLGGYHLVWSRDLVEQAAGLLACGAGDEVRSVINYLRGTQNSEGGWPQNMWLDGKSFSSGVQLDEAALPILLVNLANRESVLKESDVQQYWPMIRAAASFIIHSGPTTEQDRWENTPGLSPYTLATEVAALTLAAKFASNFGEKEVGQYFQETADLWNDLIDPWTYVRDTPLARRIGVDGYYVRIAPSPGMNVILRNGDNPLQSQAHNLPFAEVVSPDALALVRFGLRAADDPRMLNTLKVIDALTRADLPAGPCWRRYNGDYYGEHEDGRPPMDKERSGFGRAWPLLTGERGHYEIARGDIEQARRMLITMNGLASQIGLLPEQVWDKPDIPERNVFLGRPSGSAMPLVWAHSEYVRLLRSIRDGKIFDQPPAVFDRYVRRGVHSDLALWRFDHQVNVFPAGRRLRIELHAPALVHFSADGWRTIQDLQTRDTQAGLHVADLPTQEMDPGEKLCFTFRWAAAGNRWEGRDFQLTVDPPAEPSSPHKPEHATEDRNLTEAHQ